MTLVRVMSRYRWLWALVVLTLGSAFASERAPSAPSAGPLNLPPEWRVTPLPGAQAGVTLAALSRDARAPPARYQVVVIPGSGCTGWAPVAPRYFAGLLHAQLLVLHKPHVTMTAGMAPDCSPDFIANDILSAWQSHAQSALEAYFAPAAGARTTGPASALPVLLVGISEGAELLPALAGHIPALAGVVMVASSGLAPLEVGQLQAQRLRQWPAWQALQAAQASERPHTDVVEGRTLGYWRDFWRWQVTAPLMHAPWPLLRVWGDADALIPLAAYQHVNAQMARRQAPFCDWRLPGADHSLQTPGPQPRDGVQMLWARLETWARQPARGLCAPFQN